MKFVKIEIRNFGPYFGKHSLDFPTMQNRNVLLIFGDNMRGKTSLLNSLRWVLFGKALGRHLREMERISLINSDAADNGDWTSHIHLTFTDAGFEYDLRRSLEPREMVVRPKRNSDFKESVGLRKDGKVINADKVQHELNQIIPEQVSRFFLFDGELLQEYESLLESESSQGKQIKSAIEKVLGVPALIRGHSQLVDLKRKAEKAFIRDTAQVESLVSQSKQLDKIQNDIERTQRDIDNLEHQMQVTTEQADDLEAFLKEKTLAEEAQKELDKVNLHLNNISQQRTDLNEELGTLLKTAWCDLLQPRIRIELDFLNDKRKTYDLLIKQKGVLEHKIEELKASLENRTCESCGQSIKSANREKVASTLGRLEGELITLCEDSFAHIELSASISSLSQIRSENEGSRISTIEKSLKRNDIREVKLESEKLSLEEQIAGCDTALISRSREKLKVLIKNIGKIERDLEKLNSTLGGLTRKHDHLTALLSKDPKARYKKSAILVEKYTQLVAVFRNGIDALRDDLKSTVANKATTAFKALTTESSYKRLEINENYGLQIIDEKDRTVSVRSAGAEQIVAFSLIEGLKQTAGKSGVIVMDTPLGRLDPKHRRNVLEYLPQMGNQIILLVHEGEIQKDQIIDTLRARLGGSYTINRISSSRSEFIKE